VAAPVETPVDGLLDAPARRLEHRRDRQGSAGHGQAGALGQQPPQAEHDGGVADGQ
jgi:hypothetical protein